MSVSSNPAPSATATDPSAFHRLGQQHLAEGRFDEAISAFEAGLRIVEGEAAASLPATLVGDLHACLANACLSCGDLVAAAENYKAALRLMPHLTGCWCNLGSTLLRMGRTQDAIAAYLQALQLSPAHWPSRTNLAQAMLATDQPVIAKALLLEMVADRPEDGRLHHELGKVCYRLNNTEQALSYFSQALACDAADAESLYWIGAIRQERGDEAAARLAYGQAAVIGPVIRRAAARAPAAFRALALQAPFGGNTPAQFLFEDAACDIDTLALLPSVSIDAVKLDPDYDVIVNLISDPDQAGDTLATAAGLVERLGLPVINDPCLIATTAREATAAQLAGLDGCRCPRTLRLAAGGDRSPSALASLLPSGFPLLVRVAGTHGGDLFERVDDLAQLAGFLRAHAARDCYLIEYVDYRSADGQFRKYRITFAGEEVHPYHLAIGPGWKLHRDATAMDDHPWMRQEEAAFLRQPAAVLGAAQIEVLHAIRRRIGLDYFGIDCARDSDGRLLVFEVNASMLVHGEAEDGPLAYKTPHAERIRQAFGALLARKAGVA
ncbi:tetratricopeptide repeat protein [Bradyrhizobium ontarionense]|uniref:Tetratricopeptide repeat protein n=1 Tax=Bradyrhizobium ontarionense TaxID=2898149 RepID=A0ABY3RIM6_9BRAD|nr:tetratricopeptide repeat protein [Bradyrhizobium sp. A19]UFZ07206.1 tetratricopeptide repeat protein [Bradyrhizobium sp. A19]